MARESGETRVDQATLDRFYDELEDYLDVDRHMDEVHASRDFVLLIHEEIGPEDYARRVLDRANLNQTDRSARVQRKRELEEQLVRGEAWMLGRSVSALLRPRRAELSELAVALVLGTVLMLSLFQGLLGRAIEVADGAVTPGAGVLHAIHTTADEANEALPPHAIDTFDRRLKQTMNASSILPLSAASRASHRASGRPK